MFSKEIMNIRKNLDYKNTKLYLLEKTSDICGFFYFAEKICFLCKSEANNTIGEVTEYLEYKPYIYISSVENNSSFETGRYDILMLKEKEKNDLVGMFIGFCRAFAVDPVVSFYEFVHSIIVLFNPTKKEAYLNCIGTYGELSFIKIMYDKGFNISSYWHKKGVYSKYDFSLEKINIEIKTSVKDNTIFKIKHNQLFNSEPNYIGLVSINESGDNGTSLKELAEYFKAEKVFSDNLMFQIALANELKKSIDKDLYDKKFICTGIYCFDTNKIDTINNIPFCVSDVNYDYDFDLTESFNIDRMISIITKKV